MVILVRERACFRRERREDLVISPVKDRRAQDEPPQRPQETAAITGKRPIEDQDGGPENGGDEPPGVAWPILPWSLFHIEVTFEVVVFCVFRELSQGAQAKWVTTVLCNMQQCAGGNKTNIGAGEIDPGGIGHGVENRRPVEPGIGEIGDVLEGPVGEIGVAIEACVHE